jgi:hypothetical protein
MHPHLLAGASAGLLRLYEDQSGTTLRCVRAWRPCSGHVTAGQAQQDSKPRAATLLSAHSWSSLHGRHSQRRCSNVGCSAYGKAFCNTPVPTSITSCHQAARYFVLDSLHSKSAVQIMSSSNTKRCHLHLMTKRLLLAPSQACVAAVGHLPAACNRCISLLSWNGKAAVVRL